MANSFDIEESNGEYTATSHNFPDCVGVGKTEDEAILAMSRKILYIKDNDKPRYKAVVRKQIEAALERGEVPLRVVGGL